MLFRKLFMCCGVFWIILQGAHRLPGQCPITVSAGPDKVVCTSGGNVSLDGLINGNYLDFRWSPTAGLSDPSSLMPQASVTGTVTYTLTAAAFDPSAPNLINNPGFEAGTGGYSTGYSYSATPITPGTYILTTSPELVINSFPPCDDHTFGNGTGNLMLVNGNGNANTQVWCQSVPVMPNSWYFLQGWALVSPITPPAFQFSVNGNLIGSPAYLSANGCDWQNFTATWFSGSSSSATVCIYDVSGTGNGLFGNDFALDDIFMSKACTVTDQVQVEVATVNAVVQPSIILPCNAVASGITLNGSASSSGPNITYEWDGPGILSGGNTPTPVVNEPGTYTLTVSLNAGTEICTDNASINVLPDPFTVSAEAIVLEELNCQVNSITIDGSASSAGPSISYSWTPVTGILSGAATAQPEVNLPGTYTLTVTNLNGNCTATTSVIVTQNLSPAVATATASGTLPCQGPGTVQLNGNGSSTGPAFLYNWSGPGIQSGGNTLNNCVVTSSGTYTLLVTNDISGCTAQDTAIVSQNGIAPTVQINPIGQLSCSDTTMLLNSMGSSMGATYGYEWSTNDGNILGPNTGESIVIDTSGTYQLRIINLATGCSASSTILIQGNYNYPTIQFDSNLVFTCFSDSIQISGSTSTQMNQTYSWTTTNGILSSAATILFPWVAQPGLYELVSTDTLSGCTSFYTVDVSADTLPPSALFVTPSVLTCVETEFELTAIATLHSVPFWYFIPPPGSSETGIVSGETSFQPLINGAGTYLLTLIDTLNGCSSIDSLLVQENRVSPSINAGPDTLLTCLVNSITLSASGPAQHVSYQWSNATTGVQTLINQPGLVTLTATDSLNGCSAIDTVVVEQSTDVPIVNISSPSILTCEQTSTQISAGAQPSLSYTWTYNGSGGGILSGASSPTIEVGSAGTYTLVITDQNNQCTNQYTVLVEQSIDLPVANAGLPQVLSCGQSTGVQLDGSLSSTNGPFSYSWSTVDGQIQQGATSLNPTVNGPGTYQLLVTDTINGCSALAQVVVTTDANTPSVLLQDPGILTCSAETLLLGSTGSSLGPEFNYSWSGPGILTDPSLTEVSINQPGIYTLTITNTQNNCTASASRLIQQDNTAPVAAIAPPEILTCLTEQISLDGSGSTLGVNCTWFGPGLINNAQTFFPTINSPGTYTLVVSNPLNGCTASATTMVTQDIQPPAASIEQNGVLNCSSPTINLLAEPSLPGFSYVWTGPGILGGQNNIQVEVNVPGSYFLTIENTNNGCSSVQNYELVGDFQLPDAVAQANQDLTCTQLEVTLSGNGSSLGMTYLWTGPGIVSGTNTLTPTVNLAGTYLLLVSNPTNGCSNQAEVVLLEDKTPPVAQANTPGLLTCTQAQVNLNATGSSTGMNYWWTGPGILAGAASENPTVNLAGVYQLVVTNPINGCTAVSQVQVDENKTPPDVDAGLNQAFSCDTDTLTLTGSSNTPLALFSWQAITGSILAGATSNRITVAAIEGIYILSVTNPSNGCIQVDTVLVRGIQPLFPVPSLVLPNCEHPVGSIQLENGDGTFTYSIDGGLTFSADSVFTNLAPGTYQVVIESSEGCQDSTQLVLPAIANVSIQLPAVVQMDLGSGVLLQPLLNLPSTSLATIEWTPSAGLSCTDCLTPFATPVATTTYQLLAGSVDGCFDTVQLIVQVRAAGDIYVPTIFHAGGPWENATFYPHTDLTITSYQLQIFDRWGGLMYLTNEVIRGWDGKANGKWQEPGVYTYLIEMEVINRAGEKEERVLVGDVTLIR